PDVSIAPDIPTRYPRESFSPTRDAHVVLTDLSPPTHPGAASLAASDRGGSYSSAWRPCWAAARAPTGPPCGCWASDARPVLPPGRRRRLSEPAGRPIRRRSPASNGGD